MHGYDSIEKAYLYKQWKIKAIAIAFAVAVAGILGAAFALALR